MFRGIYFRFIEDWYRGGASAAEQDQFDTDSAYRQRLVDTFQEQIEARSDHVRDIAERVAAMAGRPYGQAWAIALNYVDHILDRQERLRFDRDFQFRLQVQFQIYSMLIDAPPLDSDEEVPAVEEVPAEEPHHDKENHHPNRGDITDANMTMTVKTNEPFPTCFGTDNLDVWGDVTAGNWGPLSLLFRKTMTSIIWKVCEQMRHKPRNFLCNVNGILMNWTGPKFYDHHGDSRPPSPNYSRGSPQDLCQRQDDAAIYEEALRKVAAYVSNAWKHTENQDNRNMIVWTPQLVGELPRYAWLTNTYQCITIEVWGSGHVINTYWVVHDAHEAIGHWNFGFSRRLPFE